MTAFFKKNRTSTLLLTFFKIYSISLFEKEVGMVQESHHDHVEGLGISCDLCDPECNGACEIQNPTHNKEKSNSGGGRYLEHEHVEAHQHEHNHHHHHHSIYPNSKHPLGPVTLRLPNKD